MAAEPENPTVDYVEVHCLPRKKGASTLRFTVIDEHPRFSLLLTAGVRPICVLDRAGAARIRDLLDKYIREDPMPVVDRPPAALERNETLTRARLQRDPIEATPIGSFVFEKRTALKMTQSQLAMKCGFSSGYVSLFESGRVKNPEALTMERMAAGLGIDVAELIAVHRGAKS
jgi:DNA-binding transcriptional regulator YiaG